MISTRRPNRPVARRGRLRSRSGTAAATSVAAVLLVAAASGCSGDDDVSAPTTTASESTTVVPATTTTSASAAATDLPTTATSEGSVDPGSTTTSPDGGVVDPVPDGTGFGYVTSVDVADSSISVDVAELLTGDAAVKAAVADGALEPGETSVDNDYYVRNRNPKVRVAPVAPSAVIRVLEDEGGSDLVSANLGQLAARLAASPGETGPRLAVQYVAAGGVIGRIDEMFFP